jgi:hypothetical protein
VHLPAVRAPRQLAEMQTVPAPDVENPLVARQFGEIERPGRRSDGRLLVAIDRLPGREVRVGGVLNSREVSPVDEAVGHNSQTTLP